MEESSGSKILRSKSSGAILGLSTACTDGPAAPFSDLLATMTRSLSDTKILTPIQTLDGTAIPAMMTKISGSSAQQDLEMLAIVLKSKICIYDIILSATTLTTAEQDIAFNIARTMTSGAH